jgi:hypothetical protein
MASWFCVTNYASWENSFPIAKSVDQSKIGLYNR